MTAHRLSPAGGLDTEQIAARLKAATPGPWVVGISTSREGGASWPVFRLRDLRPEDLENTQPNVALIAHAPEDIAALLREVEALRTALRRIETCAKFAGAEGHGDYRDIEADASMTLARGAPERDR